MIKFLNKEKILAIVLCALAIVGCSDNSESLETENSLYGQTAAPSQSIEHRSYEEALAVAKHSISLIETGTSMTRGMAKHRTINEKGGVFSVTSSRNQTRSSGSVDTLLYVFNFNDEQGFAVVSANRYTEGLLAITESGSYQPDKESEIMGLNDFMERAKEYVQNAPSLTPEGGSYNYWKFKIDTLAYSLIETKIPVAWGQGGIAGTYCSNGTAGCDPIAMALIMSYYQQPTLFKYTFGNRDINSESVSWSQINQHIHTSSHPYPFCNGNSNLDKTIGRICRELGSKAGSSYNSDGSTGTSPGAMYDVLTYYDYSMPGFHSLPSDENSFMNYLNENKLILMCGYLQNDTGHFWVVDGGYHINTHNILYGSQDEVNWVQYHDWTDNETYNHINWGWDGLCNGLFLYKVFNANSASQYDNATGNHISSDVNFYRGVKYSLVYY